MVAPFNYVDGKCAACRRGLYTACERGGSFGCPDYLGLPVGGCQAEAVRVPFADATLVSCSEPNHSAELKALLLAADSLSTAQYGLDRGGEVAGTDTIVIGDGPVGLGLICLLRGRHPASVTLVGHHARRADLAKKLNRDMACVVGKAPPRSGDIVFECTGTEEGVVAALAAARHSGTVCLLGLPKSSRWDSQELFRKNLMITGGKCPARAYLPALVTRIQQGWLAPAAIIDAVLPLSDAAAAYIALASRDVVKVALQPPYYT